MSAEHQHHTPKPSVNISLGTVVTLVILLLLAVYMVWPTRHPRELANRSTCAANLRGIMNSMILYSSENNNRFPLVPFAPYATVPNAVQGVTTGITEETAAMQQYYAAPNPHAGSVQACLWLMVLNGQIGAKQLLCKSDVYATQAASLTDKLGYYYNNFQNGQQLSYSMAYPWNAAGKPGAWWEYTSDSSLPIIADMNALQGTGKPARIMNPARAPIGNTTWNSGNHDGDGQNVGYMDGHAEFSRTPTVGHNNDNIYTTSASPSKGPAEFGGIPAGATAPALTAEKPPYDIILLPARNESTGAL